MDERKDFEKYGFGVLVLAMWAEGLGSLLIKGFYALESTWVPLFINEGEKIMVDTRDGSYAERVK